MCFFTGWQAGVYLQVLRDEDLAGLLDHGLGLQLLRRELPLAGVEHFLTRDAGEGQVGGVRVVPDRDLDGLRVDGAGGVPGRGQIWGQTHTLM